VKTIATISIAPIKGFRLVHPQEVELTKHGVVENRRFLLVDADGARLRSSLTPWPVRVEGTWDATRDPETGARDLNTLRLIKSHRGVRAAEGGKGRRLRRFRLRRATRSRARRRCRGSRLKLGPVRLFEAAGRPGRGSRLLP
jgi:MOSC N-terminal beta barrel domain